MVAWLKREEDFPAISRVTREIGVKPSPLSFYYIQATPNPAFVFGFGGWTPGKFARPWLGLHPRSSKRGT